MSIRLPHLTPPPPPAPPQAMSQVIDRDEEVKKIRTSIESGVEKAAAQLQEYTHNWDEYVKTCD